MRILIHDYAGHAPQLYVARELARRGHEVLFYYADGLETPRGDLGVREEDPPTLRILPVSIGGAIQKRNYLKRQLNDLAYARRFTQIIRQVRPDVVFSANTPTSVQYAGLRAARKAGAKFVFWMTDIYSAAVGIILRDKYGPLGGLVGGFYHWLERRTAQHSDHLVLIAESFLDHVKDWRIGNASVFPVCAPVAEIPVKSKSNPWSVAHDLQGSFNIVYSGTLAKKHNPKILLDLAEAHRSDTGVKIVLVSESATVDELKVAAAAKGLANIVFLPFQAYEDLPFVLGCADILLAVLEPGAAQFSLPSKVLTYLCAERPQVLSAPPDNYSAIIVSRSDGGIVVPPSEGSAGVIAAVDTLIADSELRARLGRQGRIFAETHFNVASICDNAEAIFATL